MDQATVAWGGVVLGFVLAVLPRWLDRKRNLMGYWQTLRAEIEYCQKGAIGIEKSLQLGRLPTTIYDEVLKHIVAEGDIKPEEAHILIRYYDLVRQTNASLNRAAALDDAGHGLAAAQEAGRTMLKVAKFAADAPDSYYTPTIALANKHCSKSWWQF